jgi:hypothetical protein
MLPAPGETSWPAAVVDSERRVAGDVFERNGHIDRDWRRRASMMVNCTVREFVVVFCGERREVLE